MYCKHMLNVGKERVEIYESRNGKERLFSALSVSLLGGLVQVNSQVFS